MKSFKTYINEGIKMQLIRGKNQDVLKMQVKGDPKWVELRGKPNFEIKFDKKEELHKVLSALGKSVNVSELVNGEPVGINPNNPGAKKALKVIQGLMK